MHLLGKQAKENRLNHLPHRLRGVIKCIKVNESALVQEETALTEYPLDLMKPQSYRETEEQPTNTLHQIVS